MIINNYWLAPSEPDGGGTRVRINYTIMKKLLINLLLAVLLNGFISATPSNCKSLITVATVSKMEVAAGNNIEVNRETEFEIHPLDILAFKFN